MRKKRKIRSKASKQQLLMPDWMQYKPYKSFSAYDTYYLKVANEVLTILQRNNLFGLGLEYELEGEKQLAVQITSLFEDFISEIGLWRAFTEKNKELHGYYLPFYAADYDPEYLNVGDFAYYLWHHITIEENIYYGSSEQMILDIGQQLYDLLEPKIDDAPTTDYYDKFFEAVDFEVFTSTKDVLDWLIMGSYLLLPEIGRSLQQQQVELLTGNIREYENPALLTYEVINNMDEAMFTKRSSFAAMSAPDFLAKIGNYTAAQQAALIKSANRRLHGIFIYEGEEDNALLFKFPQLDRTFRVIKKSFNKVSPVKTMGGGAMMTITEWNDNYWMTGGCVGIPKIDDQLLQNIKTDNQAQQFPLSYHPKETQEKMRSIAQDMENSFITCFGKPFCLFKNEEQVLEAQKLAFDFYNQGINDEISADLLAHPLRKDQLPITDDTYALAYEAGKGMLQSSSLGSFIRFLEKPSDELVEGDAIPLFEYALHTPPSILEYILKNYPTKNIESTLKEELTPDIMTHYAYLQRMAQPEEFGEKEPLHLVAPGT